MASPTHESNGHGTCQLHGSESAYTITSAEPYGLMLRRGDADFRLAVNLVLSRLYRSGQIYPIYERWFGAVDRAIPLLHTMYLLHGLPE